MTNEIYEKLTADFPQDAYVVDRSRGFQLIGMRSAFIVERMTEVFGLLGMGWRFVRGPFTRFDQEVTTEVIIQYNAGEGGTWPYEWNDGWVPMVDAPMIWSEPIQGVGGNQVGKGGVPVSDAQKSAESNALSKAASRLGVGIKAYKGLLTVDGQNVAVKGEDSQEKQLSEAMSGLVLALNWIVQNDPEVYDGLREKSPAVNGYHMKFLVGKVVSKVRDAKLAKFVNDNLPKIVGDAEKTSVSSLTTAELMFLNGMIDSIIAKDITWKDALKLSKSWDHKDDWPTLLGSVKEPVDESTDEEE